jgi:hypothetical protein
MSREGLHQGSSERRYASLQGAWRRQAVRGGGLYQVRSRRHGLLRGRTAGANGVKRWAVSRRLEATRVPARGMAEAGAASTRAAPSRLLKAVRRIAGRMAAANAARRRAAPSQPLVARATVRPMAGASGASTRAAPSLLKATQSIARRTAGANGASRRAASSLLKAPRSSARPTAEASAVKRRAAPRGLKATRHTVSRMAGANGVKRRAASSPLEATRVPARRMAEAGAASTWAAPSPLLEAVRPTARRMEAAGAATTRAAPSLSLELPAVCTARCLFSASSRRCVGRCTATAWRGPGAPSHGWDRGVGARLHRRRWWSVRGHRLVTAAGDGLRIHIVRTQTTESPSQVRRRAQPAHPPQHRRQGVLSSSQVYDIVMCTGPPFKTLLAHPLGAGQPAGSHRSSTQRGALGAA